MSKIPKSYSHLLIRIAFILYWFLFHIDGTIYAYRDIIKKVQYITRDIELIIKYRVIWIPSVLTVFALRTFSREVKVAQPCINSE